METRRLYRKELLSSLSDWILLPKFQVKLGHHFYVKVSAITSGKYVKCWSLWKKFFLTFPGSFLEAAQKNKMRTVLKHFSSICSSRC